MVSVGISLDINKALDTINQQHTTKIHFLGVWSTAISLLTSYLSKRMQYVDVIVYLIHYKSNVECHWVLCSALNCSFIY